MSRDATRQYSLKSRGSMFDMLHGRACAMAERGDQDGCNDICRLLLEHNDLDNDYKVQFRHHSSKQYGTDSSRHAATSSSGKAKTTTFGMHNRQSHSTKTSS